MFGLADKSPLEAVARVINNPSVAAELTRAADALQGGVLDAAADALAIAFDQVLVHITPPLRTDFSTLDLRPGLLREASRELVDSLRAIAARTDAHEAWLLSHVIAVPASRLAELRAVLGDVIWVIGGHHVSRDAVPSWAQLRAAAEVVAGVAYRLWRTGALAEESMGGPPRVPRRRRTRST